MYCFWVLALGASLCCRYWPQLSFWIIFIYTFFFLIFLYILYIVSLSDKADQRSVWSFVWTWCFPRKSIISFECFGLLSCPQESYNLVERRLIELLFSVDLLDCFFYLIHPHWDNLPNTKVGFCFFGQPCICLFLGLGMLYCLSLEL